VEQLTKKSKQFHEDLMDANQKALAIKEHVCFIIFVSYKHTNTHTHTHTCTHTRTHVHAVEFKYTKPTVFVNLSVKYRNLV
jgi:hypothetical protein